MRWIILLPLLFAEIASANSAVRLALNWKPEPEFGGFYTAQREAFFKDAGFDVEILVGGSAQPVTQMVAAGKVEYGISSADEVLLARSKGADLVAVFAVYQTNPQCLMTHEEAKITSLEALFKSDATIAMQKGLPYAGFLEKKFGFSKVQVVPYPGGIGTFLNQPKFVQQCFIFSEPISARRANAHPKTFLIADAGYNPYTTVVVTRGDLIRKSDESVKNFVRAIRKGWETYLKSPDKTNEYMFSLNSSLDLATYAEAAKIQKPLVETADTRREGLGKMKAARWKELELQLRDLKVLDHAIDSQPAFRNY